jgi:hypothetical protein
VNLNGGSILNNQAIIRNLNGFENPGTGGGIQNDQGQLNLNGCLVSGNTASLGGGIANFGRLSLISGSVTNNAATGFMGTAYGGGILDNGYIEGDRELVKYNDPDDIHTQLRI